MQSEMFHTSSSGKYCGLVNVVLEDVSYVVPE